jgi:cytochrome b6-f complex iron-sulfur subunit
MNPDVDESASDKSDSDEPASADAAPEPKRRSLLFGVSAAVMAFGLSSGYGMFGWLIGMFLYPFRGTAADWQFLSDLGSFALGQSMTYESPAGQKIVVTRLGEAGAVEDFIALSSVCPHLGCQVHWESNNTRFFCPCHNGAFSKVGEPLSGPPKDSNQSLPQYALQIKDGLLFIEVPGGLRVQS